MSIEKVNAPSCYFVDQHYKLSYFSESLSKYEEKLLKIKNEDNNHLNSLIQWYKKEILYIKMDVPFCPSYYSKNVIKEV